MEKLNIGATKLPIGHSLLIKKSADENHQKPASSTLETQLLGKSELFGKLDSFLPKLKSANADLDVEIAKGNLKKYCIDTSNSDSDEESCNGDINEDKANEAPVIKFELGIAPLEGEQINIIDGMMPEEVNASNIELSTTSNNSRQDRTSSNLEENKPIITEVNSNTM